MSLIAYEYLARVLMYPGSDFTDRLMPCRHVLEEEYPSTLPVFDRFLGHVRASEGTALEELYTRTFDVQAVCCLDVGFVLFGEDYKRGQLLVKLLDFCRLYELDCGTELADHLTNILPMVERMRGTNLEEAEAFVSRLVYPALQKMLDNFSEGKSGKGNPYANVLQTIAGVLTQDFRIAERDIVMPVGRNLPVLNYPSELEDIETRSFHE